MSEAARAIRTDGQFRYVRHGDIDRFHRDGWMVVDALGDIHHGEHATLMWRCDCEIVVRLDGAAKRDDG